MKINQELEHKSKKVDEEGYSTMPFMCAKCKKLIYHWQNVRYLKSNNGVVCLDCIGDKQ